MNLASVQTQADSGPFLPYLGGVLLFVALLAAFVFVSWFAGRYIARHVRRALDDGDRVIRDFVAAVDEWDREQVTR